MVRLVQVAFLLADLDCFLIFFLFFFFFGVPFRHDFFCRHRDQKPWREIFPLWEPSALP